jgi:hypothetical protein
MKKQGFFCLIVLTLSLFMPTGCQFGKSSEGETTASEGRALFSRSGSKASNPKTSDEVQYTILLQTFDGGSHIEQSNYYLTQTQKLARWKDLFLVHKEGHSELYRGKYKTQASAIKDLKEAKEYRSPANIVVYPQAIVLPLPGKEVGPPEWNLKNAEGDYTVVVANFYDVPEGGYYGRKQHAVEYCRQLREQGELAFYHHGASQSAVSVGLFSEAEADALKKSRPSPKIQNIIDRYKYLAVNGYSEKHWDKNPRTGQLEKMPSKPYVAHIPQGDDESTDDAFNRTGYQESR